MPAAPRRKGLLVAAGGVAVVAAVAAGMFALRNKPAPVVAVAPAATVAPVPAPAPAAPFDPLAALQQVVDGASPERGVSVTSEKSRVRIDRDRLAFSVYAARAGYVYVQMVGSDRNNFYLLFPNAIDKNNFIKAGQTMALPRTGWRMDAAGPAGTDQFVAIVSDTPRSFDAAGLVSLPEQVFGEFPIAQAQALQRTYTGTTPLFAGTPVCAATPCSPLYGASKFAIEEVAR
jgi:hypothetical protein